MTWTVDDSAWPILAVSADEKLHGDDAQALTTVIDEALARGGAEGVQLGLVLDIGRMDRDATNVFGDWFRARFDELGQRVAAGATVVAEATLSANRARLAEHPEVYPFAAWCAATVAECAAWVDEHIRDHPRR